MPSDTALELKLYHFVEATGKAQWGRADLCIVQSVDVSVLADTLDDLHKRGFMKFRRWSQEQKDWVFYAGGAPVFFNHPFEMQVTYSGRRYFESLEAPSTRVGGSGSPPHLQIQDAVDMILQSQGDSSAKSVVAPEAVNPKAFVSHASQDHAFVERFATDLRSRGVNAWYSGWEIKPGDSIRVKIEQGLEDCRFFVIVLSRRSISSPWVQTELDAATIRKIAGKVRKIIPIKIEDCGDLPPTLGSLCWEDFSTQPYDTALKRVLDSVFEVDLRPPLGKTAVANDHPLTKFPIRTDDLGAFAEQLRSEGFHARTDILDEQPGLILEAKGLDLGHYSDEPAGLFFPLWELNFVRDLVADRQFRVIMEIRPSDWQVNRPYQEWQRNAWRRSASLLGGETLDELIPSELNYQFPQDEFPVHIDVRGGPHRTFPVVQITNLNAGIDVKAEAIAQEPTRDGMKVAVVAAVQRVISDGISQAPGPHRASNT